MFRPGRQHSIRLADALKCQVVDHHSGVTVLPTKFDGVQLKRGLQLRSDRRRAPGAAASSYPVVPLIWPARNRPGTSRASRVDRGAEHRHTHILRHTPAWSSRPARGLRYCGESRPARPEVGTLKFRSDRRGDRAAPLAQGKSDASYGRKSASPCPQSMDNTVVLALDRTVEQGRPVEIVPDDFMGSRVGASDCACQLRRSRTIVERRHRPGHRVARLGLEPRPVDGAAIQSWRCPGLQTAFAQADFTDLIGQCLRRPTAAASALDDIVADEQPGRQEGACGNYDSPSGQ